MKNKSEDLRNHLFATIEALQDKDDPMDIDRAKAVALVADKVIDLAKTEIKFMEVTGAMPSSDFIQPEKQKALGGKA
jgi:hypothetical protein